MPHLMKFLPINEFRRGYPRCRRKRLAGCHDYIGVRKTFVYRARRVSSDMAGDTSIYREYEMELEKANEPYKWYPQRAGRGDLVLETAIETRAIENAAIRQEIARFHVLNESAKWTAARAKAAQKAGQPQGPEGSLGKLAASRVAQSAARVHTSIMGNGALLTGERSLKDGVLAEVLVSTRNFNR